MSSVLHQIGSVLRQAAGAIIASAPLRTVELTPICTYKQKGLVMEAIDTTINQVERLYTSITGKTPPEVGDVPYAAIPPEVQPGPFVEEQMQRLSNMLSMTPTKTEGSIDWIPAVSIWESDDSILMVVDLPGVTQSDLQLSVEGRLLRISGNRLSRATRKLSPKWIEHQDGRFERVVALPIASDNPIDATLRNGQLEVRLRRGESAPRFRAVHVN